MKKLISLALALMLAISCVSFTAFADEPTTADITYLEPTYKDDDYTKGLSGWEVVEKKGVTIATAENLSAGGWLAVTSNLSIEEDITVNNDLNLYIAKGVTLDFSYHSLTASGKTVTLYGEGTFRCTNTVTVGTLVVNGNDLFIIAPDSNFAGDGDNGHDAITGDVVLNSGSGKIYASDGDMNLGDGNGGNGGYSVRGNLHINGGNFYFGIGEGGASNSAAKGNNGQIAVNFTHKDVSIPNFSFGVSNTVNDYNNVYSLVYYLIPDNTDTTKGTLTGGSAAKDGKVAITYTTADGYLVDKLYADGVAITAKNSEGKYEHTMPNHNVILTADYVEGCFLDLDGSDTPYPDTKTIDQLYVAAVTTNKTDVTKVQVSWTLEKISVSVTNNKIWNTEKLSWDVDTSKTNGATASDPTATFNFVNLSSKDVYAKLTFAKASGFTTEPEKTFTDNGATGDGIIKLGNKATDSTTDNNGKIKLALTVTDSDFDEVAQGTGTYGTYTVTISENFPLTFAFAKFFDGEKETATVNEMNASQLSQYMVNAGMITDASEFGAVLVKTTYYSKDQGKFIDDSRTLSLLFATTGNMPGDSDFSDKIYMEAFNGSFTWDGSAFVKNS